MTRAILVTGALWCGLFALAVPVLWMAAFSLDQAPYRMSLRPAEGGCIVQFTQPDQRLISPEFFVDLPVETPHVVDLRSDDLAVPGCEVLFFDNAPSPGCFRLRIGRAHFEVMEARIVVEGRDYHWSTDESFHQTFR